MIDRVRRGGRGPALQRGFGAVMLLTSVLMVTSVDLRFQEALASHFPSFLTNPTGGLERTTAVEDELAGLRGEPKFAAAAATDDDAALPGVQTPELPVLGAAPQFAGTQRWFDTTPLTMARLRGRAVLRPHARCGRQAARRDRDRRPPGDARDVPRQRPREGLLPVGPTDGTRDYRAAAAGDLPQNVFSLGGRWRVDRESARAVRGATITARVVGRNVCLVLSSAGDTPRRVRVELDARPIAAAGAGEDVRGGVVTVRRERLYRLVKLDEPGEQVLQLRLDPDVSAFAFTFG